MSVEETPEGYVMGCFHSDDILAAIARRERGEPEPPNPFASIARVEIEHPEVWAAIKFVDSEGGTT